MGQFHQLVERMEAHMRALRMLKVAELGVEDPIGREGLPREASEDEPEA